MIISISLVLVVISPLSFIILLIWILSPFFWISLANGLLILLILLKKQLLVLLMCSTVSLVSNSLISAPILIIPLLVGGVGLICCWFSSSLRCKESWYILDLSFYFEGGLDGYIFPLRTAFAISHRFWTDVSSFSLVSLNCLSSSLISWLIQTFLSKVVFSYQVFEFLPNFFLWLSSSFKACGLRLCRE